MHIPRYWAQIRLRHETGIRHGTTVQRWGWSDDSQQAAEAHARERAQTALDGVLQAPIRRDGTAGFRRIEWASDYGLNGETPIREEILEQRGNMVLTRNSYGAHCLNTPNVAIADIDALPDPRVAAQRRFPALSLGFTAVPLLLLLLQPHAFSLQYLPSWLWIMFWGGLFARNLLRWQRARTSLKVQPAADPMQAAVERVTAFSQQHPDWGLRVYRTPKGLRVIVTHQPMEPTSAAVQSLFAALQVDPLFARLCAQQQCFRARVTGKPWRMDMNGPSEQARRWPTPSNHTEARHDWNAIYDAKAQHYSACQWVSQLGQAAVDPAVQPLVDWHDAASRALEPSLPLA